MAFGMNMRFFFHIYSALVDDMNFHMSIQNLKMEIDAFRKEVLNPQAES